MDKQKIASELVKIAQVLIAIVDETLISEVINVPSQPIPAIPSRRRRPIKEDLGLTDVPTKRLREITAKKRPDTLVEGLFFDSNELAKQFKSKISQKNIAKITTALHEMFVAAKIKVISVEPKLGHFRGHPYLTTCKIAIVVKNEETAKKFNELLVRKVSPKFKFKSFDAENHIAHYNVR